MAPKDMMFLNSKARLKKTSFDWNLKLDETNFQAVPVSSFPHAPLNEIWKNIPDVNLKVEVREGRFIHDRDEVSFWIAEVHRFSGYKAKVSFLGFKKDGQRKSKWINFCREAQRIGYSIDNGFALMPLEGLVFDIPNWKDLRDHSIEWLTGSFTIPDSIQENLEDGLRSSVQIGSQVEVVDKNWRNQMKVAKIKLIVGRRVLAEYWDADPSEPTGGKWTIDNTQGLWCHELSESMYPIGWSKSVGHEISGPPGYDPCPLDISLNTGKTDPKIRIEVGMKFEAVNPLNQAEIRVASVVKVLKHGYFMGSIESTGDEDFHGKPGEIYTFHITSPLIFHCGFARENLIKLTKPIDYKLNKRQFNWNIYLKETHSKPLPVPPREEVQHEFKAGCKLEAVDLPQPELICVATVIRVVGRLIRVHFDGWEEEYDIWTDVNSYDIFPVGWCELTNYKLESPKTESDVSSESDMFESDSAEYKPSRRSINIPGTKRKRTKKISYGVDNNNKPKRLEVSIRGGKGPVRTRTLTMANTGLRYKVNDQIQDGNIVNISPLNLDKPESILTEKVLNGSQNIPKEKN